MSLVISNLNRTKELEEKKNKNSKNVSNSRIADQIDLCVQISDLMKAYSPTFFAHINISNRFKRHQVRQLICRLKSVVLEATSQLGAQNVRELDSLISLIDLKVDNKQQ